MKVVGSSSHIALPSADSRARQALRSAGSYRPRPSLHSDRPKAPGARLPPPLRLSVRSDAASLACAPPFFLLCDGSPQLGCPE